MVKLKGIRGSGGSSSSDSTYTPVEDENSAAANTFARIVDLICEGHISGPANDNNWYKSTYYNGIPIQKSDGSYNFSGVELNASPGSPWQDYLPAFWDIENTISVGVDITVAGGSVSRTITDPDVDSCKVVINIPALMEQQDNGDLTGTFLKLAIYVTPENGAGVKQIVVDPTNELHTLWGKHISPYRHQFILTNLIQYGASPWVITVERTTPDSDTAKLINAFSWHSYTTLIDSKLEYYGRCVVGHNINSSQFGDQIPTRIYKINGIQDIPIPSNYDPIARTYSGDWDGTFTTGCTNNPAWIVYYLLTDVNNGLGSIITEDMVDKWSLYSCGVYCDGLVSVTTKIKQADGSYTDNVFSEPRFSFNGVIENRAQALEVITYISGSMRAYPVWADGQLIFIQDRPIVAPARPVSPSNVREDGFTYTGVPKRNRHTVVKISWNDPDLFGKLDTIELVDEEGVINFGYNEIDFGAIGCTSRTEAIRRGRYVLDTDINAREVVSFSGGLEWADALPGDLIAVQDPDYAAIVLEGRVIGFDGPNILLDKELTFETGITYTLLLQCAWSSVYERTLDITANPLTTNILTPTVALEDPPFLGALAVISASNVPLRKFVIINVTEESGFYNISGLEYDADKYARIDTGAVSETPVPTTRLREALDPPTNLTLQAFTYTSGDQNLRMYGITISWTPSTDARVSQYEIRYNNSTSGGWTYLDTVTASTYQLRDAVGDTYDISVRSTGLGTPSEWVTYLGFELVTSLSDLAPPTNLDTIDFGGLWSGRDCTIAWTPSIGSKYGTSNVGDSNVSRYRVEIRKTDGTLLRTVDTAQWATMFTYFYGWNIEDHGGSPSRYLLFYVYSIDESINAISEDYASLVATNPAPDMSAKIPTLTSKYAFLRASWDIMEDNDSYSYKLFFGANNPPTEEITTILHPTNTFDINGIDYETEYYLQIEPYDLFGAGVKSQVSSSANIIKIPFINIDAELTNSIVKSDSDGNDTDTLSKLYNGYFSTDGITYTLSGTDKYIQYQYGIEDYFDRIGIWTADANARVYIAYSTDGITWSYLSALSSHALDTGDKLITSATQVTAKTDYWQLEAGINLGMLPDNTVAKYIRLYLTGTYTTVIYELVPSRILISELAAIKHLSSYSANVGIITAGVLRSSNYDSTHGCLIDLDEGSISGKITFLPGSEGYSNLSDTPSYYNQSSQPTGLVIGDVWVDSDDNQIYTFNGTVWVPGKSGEDGIDGASIEFIFKQGTTSTPPSTPATSQVDDYVPAGWTDNQSGVTSTYQYEFSSKRTKTAGVWSNFSSPKLWATYSEDGAPGSPGADGVNAVIAILSNEAHTLPATSAGVVTSYTGSGTQIRVYEGTTALNYDASSTANGYWKISSVSDTNITVGSYSDSGSYVTVGNSSAMSSSYSTASITFTITGKTFAGNSFSITKTQNISKSLAGVDGGDGPALMLTATAQSFTYSNGTLDSGQSNIVLTAVKNNTSETVTWVSVPSTTGLSGTGDTKTLTAEYFGTKRQVVVTITTPSGLTDTITILRLDETSNPAARVNANTTTIEGGKITTNTIDVDHIISDSLTQITDYYASSSSVSIYTDTVIKSLAVTTLSTSELTCIATVTVRIPAACTSFYLNLYIGTTIIGDGIYMINPATVDIYRTVTIMGFNAPGSGAKTCYLRGSSSGGTCSVISYGLCIIDRRK